MTTILPVPPSLGAVAAAGVVVAALLGAAACASGRAPAQPVVPRARPRPALIVTDRTGAAIAGATVIWTSSMPLACESFGPAPWGYDVSGEGTTDESGWARFRGMEPRGRDYTMFVVGPNREKTLGLLAGNDIPKFVQLLPTVRVELAVRCGPRPCGQVAVRGGIERDGGSCKIDQSSVTSAPFVFAGLPQGDLELRFHVDEGKETEGRAVLRQPLVADVTATVDIATIGGVHRITGRVLLPDRSPPGRGSTSTTVRIGCENGLSRYTNPDPATGTFELRALPPAACAITAHHERYSEGWQATPLPVLPGKTGAVTLTLEKLPPF
jgi:hypothetical protein